MIPFPGKLYIGHIPYAYSVALDQPAHARCLTPELHCPLFVNVTVFYTYTGSGVIRFDGAEGHVDLELHCPNTLESQAR